MSNTTLDTNIAVGKKLQTKASAFSLRNLLIGVTATVAIVALYFLSQYNYLLFHGVVEVFTVVIAVAIFTIAWNTRNISDNNYMLFIGMAFVFVAGFNLLHTLAFKGMGVFPDISANLATQLWIVTRYLFAFSMFVPLVFIRRKIKPTMIIAAYSLVTALLFLSLFYWNNFPQAYIDGVGLTTFKVASEYAISAILLLAIGLLISYRQQFSANVFRLLLAGMVVAIFTEMAFTLYTDVYGIANMVGHLLDFTAFFLIYRALVNTSLTRPYDLLFRNLKASEEKSTNHASKLTQVNAALQQEIAERKIAEESMKAGKLLLESTFDSMYEGVFILDKTGKVIDFNNAFVRINKFTNKEDVLKSINSLGTVFRAYHLDGTFVPLGEWPATKALQGESGTNQEFIVERTDLGVRWITSNSYAPLRNEVGEIVGAIQTMHDITERKKAEQKVKESETIACKRAEDLERLQSKLEEKAAEVEEYATNMENLAQDRLKQLQNSERLAAIGATAAMVGHDIRNPLQSISSDLYFAKKDLAKIPESPQTENIKESLDGILSSIDYINKIVQDLQDFARPIKLNFQETNLDSLCQETLLKLNAPSEISVSYNISDDAKIVTTDGTVVKRILSNLTSNAIQAMPDGGKLIVAAYNRTGRTILTVEDTGVGIPPDIKEKLFTPMFTTKAKGQGFGLAVVKRMTEALGGTITYESEVGKGTKFIVSIPTDRC